MKKIAKPHVSRPPRLPRSGHIAFPTGGAHAFRGPLTPAQPDQAFPTAMELPQGGAAPAPAMPEG